MDKLAAKLKALKLLQSQMASLDGKEEEEEGPEIEISLDGKEDVVSEAEEDVKEGEEESPEGDGMEEILALLGNKPEAPRKKSLMMGMSKVAAVVPKKGKMKG